MYTDSLEQEKEFLDRLLASRNEKTAGNVVCVAGICPKCHNGNVVTKCIHEYEDRRHRRSVFTHVCDRCGEEFKLNRIRADIVLHSNAFMERLETPFGDIRVRINGAAVPFKCRNESRSRPEDDSGKPVSIRIIDIDLADCKPGDTVLCGFDEDLLEYNDGDEHSLIFSCESEEYYLGFCAFDTDEDDVDVQKYYCYELKSWGSKGFGYRVIADPRHYDTGDFLKSTIVSPAVSCISSPIISTRI